MERHTAIAEDLPEDTTMETKGELKNIKEMFGSADIPAVVRFFQEADVDGGGGLDMDEFCIALEQLYGAVNRDEVIALHMQIDINCDGTVDLDELLNFILTKNKAKESINLRVHAFPQPVEVVSVNHYSAIIKIIFRPSEDNSQPSVDSQFSMETTRTYQNGHYLTISSDGIFTFWTDSFKTSRSIKLNKMEKKLPFSHRKRMCVNDMVYISELNEMAIATSGRELVFYTCNNFPELFRPKYALILDDSIVNTMTYWSDGIKAIFCYGSTKGYMSVFVSYNIKNESLFHQNAYEKVSLHDYPTVYESSLLKKWEGFLSIKLHIFDDICHQIRYLPSLDCFAVCSQSFRTMVIATLPKPPQSKVQKKVFESSKDNEFFTCFEYCPSIQFLVTGGTDGKLRLWYPYDSVRCKKTIKGHVKAISHMTINERNKVVHSVSVDNTVCLWSEETWVCLQRIQVQKMRQAPISSVCFNVCNNQLVLANSDIGTFLGRGTDLFIQLLTSHDKPICDALYHSIFKQVISICKNGMVKVWDILTGKAVVQFKVTPDQHEGFTTIAFDGSQRRLITVSDGKVRLWNFNNGEELGVHPVTVQKEVTSIVAMNNRVFVAGRRSKVIFNLDLEEAENIILEHDYLNDICSMSAHGNTLLTASSNGNIVVWDADTAEVYYWLETNNNPRTHMADKKAQGYVKDLPADQKKVRNTGKNSLCKKSALINEGTDVTTDPIILCLQTRMATTDTATLLISENFHIYAWSIISKGGLLGKFRVGHQNAESITTMTTDAKEKILLVGTSNGYIFLWDIQQFGFRKKEDCQGPSEVIKGWRVSLSPPPLLGYWEAHKCPVASVKCDSQCRKIITASDLYVNLWTNKGEWIGTFGKHEWDDMQLSLKLAGKPGEAMTGSSQMPLPESPEESQIIPLSLPDYTDLFEEIEEVTRVPKPRPILTEKEMFKKYVQAMMITPSLTKIKNKEDLSYLMKEKDKNSTPQKSWHTQFPSNSDIEQLKCIQFQFTPYRPLIKTKSRDTFKDSDLTSPPDTLPGKQESEKTSNHVHTLKDSVVTSPDAMPSKQESKKTSNHIHFPPIPDQVQLKHNQSPFHPHPPQIPRTTGRTDIKQNSPQAESSSYINKSRPKYGRVLKIKSRDTLKDGVLKSPPDIMPGKQESKKTSSHIHFPPIPDQVQLKHNQSPFHPHPPQIPRTSSRTDVKQSSPQAESSSYLNNNLSKYGRMLMIKSRDKLKDSVVTSPPDAMPGKQESKKASNHVRFPPIPDQVQLTHNQSPFDPHPPQIPRTTGRTDIKQSSPQAKSSPHMNKSQSKLTHNQSLFGPHQPQTLLTTGQKKESAKPSKHVSFPPILDKVQLTNQTEDKLHPPKTLLTTGRKKGSQKPSKHVCFPPIPDKVQLTNQTEDKLHPPKTLLTTGRKKGSKKPTKHVHFSPFPDKVVFINQTQD